jgi:hypothetical protein
MSSAARMVGLLAVAALLILGAAGFSGYLTLPNDRCSLTGEGTSVHIDTRWTPPGIECVYESSPRADDGKLFTYDEQFLPDERSGSWPVFLGTLLFGLATVFAALRRRPVAPAWLRMAAVTTLTFAFGGALAVEGGVQVLVIGLFYLGLPFAITADWALQGGGRPWQASLAGAVVALPAAAFATFAFLMVGIAAYGVTIVLVAGLAAVPWRRLSRWRLATP